MSRTARTLLALALIFAVFSGLCAEFLPPFIHQQITENLGLEVQFQHLRLGWDAGPALAFRDVDLRDPKSSAHEHAEHVFLRFRPGHLRLGIVGLQTLFTEDDHGAYHNAVWESLLTALRAAPDTLKDWDIRFHKTQVRVRFAGGERLDLEAQQIVSEARTSPIVIRARSEDSNLECALPRAAGVRVLCTSPSVDIGRVMAALTGSELLPLELREDLQNARLAGGARDVRVELFDSGDLNVNAQLAGVSGRPVSALPRLRGVDASFSLRRQAGTWTLDATGEWLKSPLRAHLVSVAGTTHLDLWGTATPATVAALTSAHLASYIQGETPLRLQIDDQPGRELRWDARSVLHGVSVNLPYPLAKTAPQETALHLHGEGSSFFADYEAEGVRAHYADRTWTVTATRADLKYWMQALKSDDGGSGGERLRLRETPALVLKVDQASFGGKTLGHLTFASRHSGDTLLVDRFRLDGAHQHLVLTAGQWRESEGTRLRGWFETSDVGETLDLLELPRKIELSPFRVGFELGWAGAPWEARTQTLNGDLECEIAKGNLQATNPILRRILSLAAIDIRNTFAGGLQFERGRAHFTLENGILRTKDGAISGLNMRLARFQFRGEADLNDMTVDGGLKVTPYLSGSILNTALVALVPVAGLTVMALESDEDSYFNRVKTQRYSVRNSLSDPQFHFEAW